MPRVFLNQVPALTVRHPQEPGLNRHSDCEQGAHDTLLPGLCGHVIIPAKLREVPAEQW